MTRPSYTAEDPNINEENWIDIVVGAAQTVSHKTQPTPQELVADLDRLIYTQNEPFGSTSIYAQHRVFRLAQENGIKVMLDGQGADELLGGYYPYLASLIRQGKWLRVKQFFQKICQFPGAENYPFFKQALGLFLPLDLKTQIKGYLGKPAFPLWLNAPWFQARRVRNNAIPRLQGTDLLRAQLLQSLDASLPEPICARRNKIGFATPELNWLTTLNPWVEKVLKSEMAHTIPVLNIEVIQQEWQAILQQKSPFDFRVWRWLNLIQWAEQNQITFD